MIGREGEFTVVVSRQVDHFNADRRVIQIATVTPLTDARMPSAMGFIHQVENFLHGITGFQVAGVGDIRNQIVRADIRAGQGTDRI
ncbi:hypothetical protein D3C87_1571790 [compost metagenome]